MRHPTPSALRPGKISDDLTASFKACGYPLQTCEITSPGLIEVYPHPALVELAGAQERLPYKAAKIGRYWPALSPAERWLKLNQQWADIIWLLEKEVEGVSAALPPPGSDPPAWERKAYEDMLDAVVCAWVAICALEGRAKAFGNTEAAIWIPTPRP
jgi:predicted RNase H-like nuclease